MNYIQKGWYVYYEKRIDLNAGVDKSNHSTLGLSPIHYVPERYDTFRVELNADLVLYNTCTIRDNAEQKVYSFLGRQAKESTKHLA